MEVDDEDVDVDEDEEEKCEDRRSMFWRRWRRRYSSWGRLDDGEEVEVEKDEAEVR